MKKIIRTSTISLSLDILLKGQLAFLNEHFEVIAVSGQDEHLDVVKNREKVRTVSVKMKRRISPIKDVVSLVKLYFLFKKEKPEIVHSITPKAGLLSMIAAFFARVPIRIHTFTGLLFPYKKGLFQILLITMDRLLCSCATDIYPEGNGVKQDLLKFNITKKPLKILANGNVNGIDVEYFNPTRFFENQKTSLRKKLNIPEENFIFIFVGRLVGDKGINELVEAFNNLYKKNKKINLLLVGSFEDELDPLDKKTKVYIDGNSNIISVGFQKDVRPYFAISNVLVFPSYREGFPNVVIQAGAMGLPSIVTNISGSNEIIIPNKNGLIVPKKNIKALESEMFNIMDLGLYKNLKLNSRALVVNRYQQKLVHSAILDAYNINLKKTY